MSHSLEAKAYLFDGGTKRKGCSYEFSRLCPDQIITLHGLTCGVYCQNKAQSAHSSPFLGNLKVVDNTTFLGTEACSSMEVRK